MLLQYFENRPNLAVNYVLTSTSISLNSFLWFLLILALVLLFARLRKVKERNNEVILRDRYISALIEVQFELLAYLGNSHSYEKIILTLGKAARASRVYIWESDLNKESSLTHYQVEWCASEIASPKKDRLSQTFYQEILANRISFFSQGQYLHEVVEDLPGLEKNFFIARDVLSVLIFPLMVNKECWGIIGFENCLEAKLWESIEITWLHSSANAIALAQANQISKEELEKVNFQLEERATERSAKLIQTNEKLLKELTQRKQIQENLIESQLSLTTINRISTGIIDDLSIEKIIAETFQRLGKYYLDISIAYAVRHGRGELEVRYHYSHPGSNDSLIGKKIELNVVPNCLENLSKGAMIIANDISKEPQLLPLLPQLSNHQIGSWLVASLHNSKKFFGLIYFYTSEPRNWSYYEISTLKESAKYLSIALKNYQTETQLQEYRNHLQQLVQERTQSLVKTNQKLKKEISDRLQVEEALRHSEDRFRVTFNQAAIGIIQTDLKGNFLNMNPKFCQIIGYSRSELLTKNIEEITHPDDRENSWQLFSQLLAGETSTFVLEERYVCKNGSLIWANSTASLVYLPNGKPHYTIGIIEDISERKEIKEKIKASLREKEILLKEIHHRVKNNLHIISSLLDLQSDYLEDERFSSIFADSQSRIETMALVHEQLYQSKDLRQINLEDYIHRLMDNLAISYNCDLSIISLFVEVEPVILNLETAIPCGLLINELVTNCFKYAFPYGRSGKIHIKLQQNTEKRICLAVWDNGVGIPPSVDWQNSNSLGLELVHTLAEQLHAEITLDRKNGTSFTFRFFQLNYKARF
ncbi:MAG: PAS domain S-box protein [Spirulinaceae cyanobacterium]